MLVVLYVLHCIMSFQAEACLKKGALLFMSINILHQLEFTFAKFAAVTARSIHKTASIT